MTIERPWDAIVLGLGAMGSAAVYQLAKRGARVLGIDRYSPPHTLGSTHGDTRITRQAIGEGEHYTPLALRSYELWREVERLTGETLLTVTGGLIISDGKNAAVQGTFLGNTLAAAKKYGVRHELLDARAMRERFPQFNVREKDAGYYEYDAGYLRPEACVAANLRLATEHGAEVCVNERATAFSEQGGGVSVTTDRGEYRGYTLIVTPGPWLPELMAPEYAKLFSIRRQVMYWFDIDAPADVFLPRKFPVFIWDLPALDEGFYGFPAIDGVAGGVKVATEQYTSTTTADAVEREVKDYEARSMHERYIAPNLRGISSRCVRSTTCPYTVTPDRDFVLDRLPEYPHVIIASPCSGHGFKHSAAIGEALAQLALDAKTQIDISKFAIDRFRPA